MLQNRDAFRRSAANHATPACLFQAAEIPQEPWEESAPGGVGTSGTGAPRPPNLLSRCTIRFKRIARGDADPNQFADFGSQFWPSRLTDLHSQCRFDLIERQSSANESGIWRQRSATGLASPAAGVVSPTHSACSRLGLLEQAWQVDRNEAHADQPQRLSRAYWARRSGFNG